jgi:hypothetical protein
MFARSVSIRLKPNSVALVTPNGAEAVAISLWDQKENADAYSRDAYPGLLKTLAKVVEGTPQVHTYEVVNSTSHKIATHVTA